MEHNPVVLYPIIQSTSTDGVRLLYTCPLHDCLPQEVRLPLITTPDSQITMVGNLINANVNISSHTLGTSSSQQNWPKFVSVPSEIWLNLLKSVKEDNRGATLEAAIYANEAITDLSDQGSSIIQIEPDKARVNLNPGNVAKVQICAEVNEGILQPSVQLFSPAPSLEMCLEHKSDPLKCFIVKRPSESDVMTTYSDIATFRDKWLSVIQLEAADLIVSKMKPVVVNNVTIKWQKVVTENERVYQASVKLPLELCHKQKFTFALDQYTINMLSMFSDYTRYFTSHNEESSFVCVRHPLVSSGKPLPEGLSKCAAADGEAEISEPNYTWVGHCVVLKTVIQGGEVEMVLKLLQSAVPLPYSLIEKPQLASIEVLEKPDNIR